MNHHKNVRTHVYSRVLIVERVVQRGQAPARVASELGISERTVHKWLGRYRDQGWSGLDNRSSRPKRMPNKICDQIAATICALRRDYHMTAMAISRALRKTYSVVARILAQNGLGQGFARANADKPRRYERTKPGELIHMDIKTLNRFWQPGHRVTGDRRSTCKGAGWKYVHVAIDDYSRMAYAETLEDSTARTCAAFMLRALRFFRQNGIHAQRVMTDNGTAYISRYFPKSCAGSALNINALSPIHQGLTARPNALYAPCSMNGPMHAPIPHQTNAPRPCLPSLTSTTIYENMAV